MSIKSSKFSVYFICPISKLKWPNKHSLLLRTFYLCFQAFYYLNLPVSQLVFWIFFVMFLYLSRTQFLYFFSSASSFIFVVFHSIHSFNYNPHTTAGHFSEHQTHVSVYITWITNRYLRFNSLKVWSSQNYFSAALSQLMVNTDL